MTIAVLGFNLECSEYAIKCLVENDLKAHKLILFSNRSRTVMSDGTEYIAVGRIDNLIGNRIDQLFIVDDSRTNVLSKRAEDIRYIKNIMSESFLGTEFQVQELTIPYSERYTLNDNNNSFRIVPYKFGDEICELSEFTT